jgi:integrase
MTRGDGWIERRGGSLRIRWRDGDVTRSRAVADEDEAERELLKVRQGKRRGTYVAPVRLTVRELVEQYLERATTRLSPNTLGEYERYLTKVIGPELGDVLVQRLTTAKVQHWIDGKQRAGVGAGTINNLVNILSGAYREAERLGIVEHSPVRRVIRPRAKAPGKEAWSADEVRRVLDAVKADAKWHAWYRLALGTGMRPGELLSLRWSQVDLAKGEVFVSSTLSRNRERQTVLGEQTKTKRVRTIVLPASVIPVLKAWRARQRELRLAHGSWVDLDLVFDRGDGSWLDGTTMRRMHRRWIEPLDVTPIPPHGLRHTYATLALDAGISIKVISDTLGHTSVAMTADRYMHVDRAMQKRSAEIMDDLLFGS